MMSVETLETKDGELDPGAVNALFDQVTEQDRSAEPDDKKETKRPDDDSVPSGDGDKDSVASGDDGLDWFSADDAREMIESLGLSPEDVAEFGDRDDFDRHVRLLDKQFMREGKDAKQRLQPGDEQQAAIEAAEQQRKVEQQRQRASEQPRDGGKFVKQEADELVLDPIQFDDELVKVFGKAAERIKQLEARIEQMGQKEVETQHQANVRQFDAIVDQLGHEDLFGNSEQLQPEYFKARAQLWDALATLAVGMVTRGKQVSNPITKAMVVRALNAEFSDKIQQKQRRSFSERVRKQAGRRFGGGSQRAPGKQYTGPLEKDPDLLAAYNAMLAEAD
jgi:hypothetical protein